MKKAKEEVKIPKCLHCGQSSISAFCSDECFLLSGGWTQNELQRMGCYSPRIEGVSVNDLEREQEEKEEREKSFIGKVKKFLHGVFS